MHHGKLVYLKEEGAVSAWFKLFLRGLYAIGWDAVLLDDIAQLMPAARERGFRCTVVLSGCSRSELLMIPHALMRNDPAQGRDMRIIVMTHPGDSLGGWKRREFAEVAGSPEELRGFLEKGLQRRVV